MHFQSNLQEISIRIISKIIINLNLEIKEYIETYIWARVKEYMNYKKVIMYINLCNDNIIMIYLLINLQEILIRNIYINIIKVSIYNKL